MTGAGAGPWIEPDLTSAAGPTWADQSRGWRLFRGILIVSWLILMALAVAVGERPSSYSQLKSDVATGRVHEVRIADDLHPGTRYSFVAVHWHRGLFNYQTEVLAARPRSRAPQHGASAVVSGSVAARLTALQPGLKVTHIRRTSYASIWGWQIPSWMSDAALLLWLGVLVLSAGPRPWRATRWAWFWLVTVTAPLGIPAFLFLSGPAPPLPAPSPGAKRLTGGWAFLLAVVLSKAFAGNS